MKEDLVYERKDVGSERGARHPGGRNFPHFSLPRRARCLSEVFEALSHVLRSSALVHEGQDLDPLVLVAVNQRVGKPEEGLLAQSALEDRRRLRASSSICAIGRLISGPPGSLFLFYCTHRMQHPVPQLRQAVRGIEGAKDVRGDPRTGCVTTAGSFVTRDDEISYFSVPVPRRRSTFPGERPGLQAVRWHGAQRHGAQRHSAQ